MIPNDLVADAAADGMGAVLAGPGREIMAGGWGALRRGAPDMNSLVAMGACAAYGVSCVAAAAPALAWGTFFEEPAMLLAFVLLGRTLEHRAKISASSSLLALQVPHGPPAATRFAGSSSC